MMGRKINQDMLFSLLNQFWRVISGPVMLLCIPLFLTAVEQGYWYTFSSIAALSIFADLGFTTIILQFTAHEFARLRFDSDGTIAGDGEALWRLASFLRFAVRWLRRIILVVFPLILLAGWMFIAQKGEPVDWELPWVIYACFSGINFFVAALLSFFEGCNSVALVQRIRMNIAMASSATVLLTLCSGGRLLALACGMVLSVSLGAYLLWRHFAVALRQLWRMAASGATYDWWPEFSRLIWRYAISWCSGYFIFQLFVPLSFYYFGSEHAGRVGMSITAWTAGFSIASCWIQSVVPRVNMLIEVRDWAALDRLFFRRTALLMATMVSGGALYFALSMLFSDFFIFHRLLSLRAMFILFVCWLCQSWVNAIAIYLRGHKEEPLMQLSAVSGVYVGVTTYLCARFLPPDYIFVGFLSSYIWGIPLVYRIYLRYKRRHAEAVCREESYDR